MEVGPRPFALQRGHFSVLQQTHRLLFFLFLPPGCPRRHRHVLLDNSCLLVKPHFLLESVEFEDIEQQFVDYFIAGGKAVIGDCLFGGERALLLWVVDPFIDLFVAFGKVDVRVVLDLFGESLCSVVFLLLKFEILASC